MLIGYVIDVGASMRLTATPATYSVSVMLGIALDLGMFLAVGLYHAKR